MKHMKLMYISDYKKTFDTAPHQRLMCKLQRLAFAGNSVIWLSSLPTGRLMRVVLEGSNSTSLKALSGIPRGSVIGPLLFRLFVNQLRDSCICMFAPSPNQWLIMQKAVRKRSGFIKPLVRTVDVTVRRQKCKVTHIRNPNKTSYTARKDSKERSVRNQ